MQNNISKKFLPAGLMMVLAGLPFNVYANPSEDMSIYEIYVDDGYVEDVTNQFDDFSSNIAIDETFEGYNNFPSDITVEDGYLDNEYDNNLVLDEKLADPMEKYTDTEEYRYLIQDEYLLNSDNPGADAITLIEKGKSVKITKLDTSGYGEYAMAEYEGLTGFINLNSLSSKRIFESVDKKVYVKKAAALYKSEDLVEKEKDLTKGEALSIIGEAADIYKVALEGESFFIKKDEVSDKKVLTDEEEKAYALRKTQVYLEESEESEVIHTYEEDDEVEMVTRDEEWIEVNIDTENFGFVKSEDLTDKPSSYSLGQEIVDYGLQFVGNPYVYGGNSLTRGIDCSGFTQQIYRKFGYSLPRSSYSQRFVGRGVSYSEAQPGDIICYSGHVAIYMGNGQIVHASTPRSGIKVGPAQYGKRILTVRRIID